jgi:hypothetical protein
MAPHRHLVVDVMVKSALTNTNVPHIGALLPLPGSLALRAEQGKLDADLRTSGLLGTPSDQSVRDYYPFALEDGGRLAPMAVEVVDRLAIFVAARRSLGMGAAKSRALRFDNNVRLQHFVRRFTFVSFRRFFEGCAARYRATSFCCSSWYFGFLSSRLVVGGQCSCYSMPNCSSGLGLSGFSSLLLFTWWFPLVFHVRNNIYYS